MSRDLFSLVAEMKFSIVFRAYHEIFMVARSYRAFVADIKSLLIKAVVGLETRLKVPILVIFGRFLVFFKLSVSAQAFDLG